MIIPKTFIELVVSLFGGRTGLASYSIKHGRERPSPLEGLNLVSQSIGLVGTVKVPRVVYTLHVKNLNREGEYDSSLFQSSYGSFERIWQPHIGHI